MSKKPHRTLRELRRDIHEEMPPEEHEELIDRSLKLSRPKFTSRIYYSLILVFGTLLLVALGDFKSEVSWALIGIAVAAFIALWVTYAVKVHKYRKWYREQYDYLSMLEQSDAPRK